MRPEGEKNNRLDRHGIFNGPQPPVFFVKHKNRQVQNNCTPSTSLLLTQMQSSQRFVGKSGGERSDGCSLSFYFRTKKRWRRPVRLAEQPRQATSPPLLWCPARRSRKRPYQPPTQRRDARTFGRPVPALELGEELTSVISSTSRHDSFSD